MKVHFKTSVVLPGAEFQAGEHDLPDSFASAVEALIQQDSRLAQVLIPAGTVPAPIEPPPPSPAQVEEAIEILKEFTDHEKEN